MGGHAPVCSQLLKPYGIESIEIQPVDNVHHVVLTVGCAEQTQLVEERDEKGREVGVKVVDGVGEVVAGIQLLNVLTHNLRKEGRIQNAKYDHSHLFQISCTK